MTTWYETRRGSLTIVAYQVERVSETHLWLHGRLRRVQKTSANAVYWPTWDGAVSAVLTQATKQQQEALESLKKANDVLKKIMAGTLKPVKAPEPVRPPVDLKV